MEATIIDLRYHMKDVLKALERNEEVKILYHGQQKGVIIPTKHAPKKLKVQDHPFFGMLKNNKTNVTDILDKLRGGRYHDI